MIRNVCRVFGDLVMTASATANAEVKIGKRRHDTQKQAGTQTTSRCFAERPACLQITAYALRDFDPS